jgi:pre-mRNA-splicing helicase BRR2
VLGDPSTNKLLAIKRVSLGKAARVKLPFEAPGAAGAAKLTLFFMCDSWLGCDQVGVDAARKGGLLCAVM